MKINNHGMKNYFHDVKKDFARCIEVYIMIHKSLIPIL